jgi:hypothetical protein
VIIFYIICPIPIAIGRRCASNSGYGVSESTGCSDLVWFITSIIVVSAFGLPAVLCRAGTVSILDNENLFLFFKIKINLDCW